MYDRTNRHTPITAEQMIAKLSALDPQAPLLIKTWDSEWGTVYHWAVADVSENGFITRGGIVHSFDDNENAE